MKVRIEPSWETALQKEFSQEYFLQLAQKVKEEYSKFTCFPKAKDLFNCFQQTPFDAVNAVILGQDPYHGFGQAHGLCFSVPNHIPLPPSLKNIFIELKNDIGIEHKKGDLTHWAQQGILLLNAVLTVRLNEAGSHQNLGWERFTDAVIQKLSHDKNGLIFVLWGTYAQKKIPLIDQRKHHILSSAHPSPLSVYRGFWNSKPFSQINNFLMAQNKNPIIW